MSHNAHKTVTDKILAQLKAGTVPWVKPWKSTGGVARANLPKNAVTGRRYSGVNIWLLWMAAAENGWADGRYLTYKQASEAGGNVRRGESGTKVYLVKRVDVKDRDDPDRTKNVSILREYTVFNVAQCDGLPEKITGAPVSVEPVHVPMDAFLGFVHATGADIKHGGDKAVFIPSLDQIHMPYADVFVDIDNYRATLAHELVHWTGVKSRCDRDMRGRFGDASYALEELVAELGAAIICAEYGVTGQLQHADYIANWIRVLTDHDNAFFAAASAASKAVEFLQGLGGTEEMKEAA